MQRVFREVRLEFDSMNLEPGRGATRGDAELPRSRPDVQNTSHAHAGECFCGASGHSYRRPEVSGEQPCVTREVAIEGLVIE